jgi:hypothetical protein
MTEVCQVESDIIPLVSIIVFGNPKKGHGKPGKPTIMTTVNLDVR